MERIRIAIGLLLIVAGTCLPAAWVLVTSDTTGYVIFFLGVALLAATVWLERRYQKRRVALELSAIWIILVALGLVGQEAVAAIVAFWGVASGIWLVMWRNEDV